MQLLGVNSQRKREKEGTRGGVRQLFWTQTDKYDNLGQNKGLKGRARSLGTHKKGGVGGTKET